MIKRPYRVRHTPEGDQWQSGYYTKTGRWSPALTFSTVVEAMLHAASQNRRQGLWS